MQFQKSKSTGIIRVILGKNIHIATICPENQLGVDVWVIEYPHTKSRQTQDTELQAMSLILQAAIRLSDGIIQACESDEPRIVYVD